MFCNYTKCIFIYKIQKLNISFFYLDAFSFDKLLSEEHRLGKLVSCFYKNRPHGGGLITAHTNH
jgi:hypothetical protein